jgi:predicted acylesterase/phospholipase RssA
MGGLGKLVARIADGLGIVVVAGFSLGALVFALLATSSAYEFKQHVTFWIGRAAVLLGVAIGIGGALFSLRYVRNARWVTGAIALGGLLAYFGVLSIERSQHVDQAQSSAGGETMRLANIEITRKRGYPHPPEAILFPSTYRKVTRQFL